MNDLLKLSAKALVLGVLVFFACQLREISALNLLVMQSFGMEEFSAQMLGAISTKLFALIFFQITEGNEICRHFEVASVYYFSRQMKKGRWFAGECGKLLLKCVVFTAVYLGAVGTALMLAGEKMEGEYFVILAYQTVIFSLWLYFNCMLMNALALLADGVTGFFTTMLLQGAELCLLSLASVAGPLRLFWMVPEEELIAHARILKLNPAFHLFLGWHSGDFASLDALEAMFHPLIDFRAWESLCLFLAISLIVTLFGLFAVKKTEIIALA